MSVHGSSLDEYHVCLWVSMSIMYVQSCMFMCHVWSWSSMSIMSVYESYSWVMSDKYHVCS